MATLHISGAELYRDARHLHRHLQRLQLADNIICICLLPPPATAAALPILVLSLYITVYKGRLQAAICSVQYVMSHVSAIFIRISAQ